MYVLKDFCLIKIVILFILFYYDIILILMIYGKGILGWFFIVNLNFIIIYVGNVVFCIFRVVGLM